MRVPRSGSACREVVVEAVDRGLVFVRTGDGTYAWDHGVTGKARWTLVGEGEFRVADARNGRILCSYVAPTPASNSPVADWAFTEGDHAGGEGRDLVHLRHGRVGPGRGQRRTVGRRVLRLRDPVGQLHEIGEISTRSGDPMFIGDDM